MQQVPLPIRLCRQVDYKVSPPQQCGEVAHYDGYCRRHRLRHLVEADIARGKVDRVLEAVERFLACTVEETKVCYESLQDAYLELKEWERK